MRCYSCRVEYDSQTDHLKECLAYKEFNELRDLRSKGVLLDDALASANHLIDKLSEENKNLKRIIAKEITEHDELGSEFVYVCELKRQNKKLREALAWYAKIPAVFYDNSTVRVWTGELAREALKECE